MTPIRYPARPWSAIAALTVFLVTGCGAFLRSAPEPLDLPAGTTLAEHADQNRAWWKARFRFSWPEGKDPRWFMDLLIADRLVAPVLVEHRHEIALWRVHRRAARDGAGHQFSFLFYANRRDARRILAELGQASLLKELHDADLLDSVVFEEPAGKTDTEPGGTSDPNWSDELRTAWPYYIMGVSGMWLELIHQVSAGVSPPDGSPEELIGYYRQLDHRLNRIWEDEAQHALLHHLNAVFGYRPMMIQKRMRF